ncbi:type II toxin-antitoxin system VapC family toxin [Roseateles puraquae]|uniref:VapC toxin family PIN domain ribonuclease n=1 Tax=Roseateles puraquae TaxID=431059 RepID=A0A254NCF7_9BURK|nr:type II toxin-antitoxin system VapC family toxin [Roseateles puraquae]MCF8205793.1 type II toxin-antitoxin system VapC family toxin [Methylotenera sp.]MDG0852620.1 type II toxin-antitoxin system VapC family toxin [Roseateles puraquae]OWR05334.1 VapC toxin family PIN domain ribonuclease [Roseateles puraquae]
MIAADSSVLIDVIAGSDDASAASAEAVRQALRVGPVVLSEVALAEICTAFQGGSEVLRFLEDLGIRFDAMEAKSALRAGEMQRRYRQRGGNRSRTVADFLIGAHAMMQCDALITRDAGFYRDYFKGLRIIVPAHP